MAISAESIETGRGDVDLDRDRLLVLRYQAGDGEAFDELYRRYSPRLHLYCMRRVGDAHVAEELAQEAFVRALNAMSRFGGDRRFYPWMTVIAQRLCIDHHRRSARVEPAPEIDTGSVEPDHDDVFAAVDHDHLVLALDRLAPRHRQILDMRESQGMSYNSIAGELDVPLTTVEALLHRARKALRREFLSVSGGGKLALLPLLGGVAAQAWKTKAKLAMVKLAPVVVPAAAGLAVVGLGVVPMVRQDPPAPAPTAPLTAGPVTLVDGSAADAGETVDGADAAAVAGDPSSSTTDTTLAPTGAPAEDSVLVLDLGLARLRIGPFGTLSDLERASLPSVLADLGFLGRVAIEPDGIVLHLLDRPIAEPSVEGPATASSAGDAAADEPGPDGD